MHQARRIVIVAALLAPMMELPSWQAIAQVDAPQLNESGFVNVSGRKTPYLIRHLPISSFPALPAAVQAELERRGCLIPQTYEAHRPENVVHGSFEKPGSSDWAVLCSARGEVSLLVFFSRDADQPAVLASGTEATHLQAHDLTGVLGFNWGIDAASPERVRDAQSAMEHRPAKLDHDAVAESVVDQRAFFHFFSKGAWSVVDTGE